MDVSVIDPMVDALVLAVFVAVIGLLAVLKEPSGEVGGKFVQRRPQRRWLHRFRTRKIGAPSA